MCWTHIRPVILAPISTDPLQVFRTYLRIPLHCLVRWFALGVSDRLFSSLADGFLVGSLPTGFHWRSFQATSVGESLEFSGLALLVIHHVSDPYRWTALTSVLNILFFVLGRGNELEFKMGRSVLEAYLTLFIQSLSLSDMISLLQYIKHTENTHATQDCAEKVAYTVYNAHTHAVFAYLTEVLRDNLCLKIMKPSL